MTLTNTRDKEGIESIHKAIKALSSSRQFRAEEVASLKDRFTESIRKYSMKAAQIAKTDRRAIKAIEEVTNKIEIARKETIDFYATLVERAAKLSAKIDSAIAFDKDKS